MNDRTEAPPRALSAQKAADGPFDAADAITLDYDARFRRRRMMTADGGLRFLLDLPQAEELAHGDALALEDGRLILVRAAAEPVADLFATARIALPRLAWHLGNRHLPTQIFDDRLRVRQDHVIEAMAAGLGARVARLQAPFAPEGGAYGPGGGGHGHSHNHDHGHGRRRDQGQDPAHAAAAPRDGAP